MGISADHPEPRQPRPDGHAKINIESPLRQIQPGTIHPVEARIHRKTIDIRISLLSAGRQTSKQGEYQNEQASRIRRNGSEDGRESRHVTPHNNLSRSRKSRRNTAGRMLGACRGGEAILGP